MPVQTTDELLSALNESRLLTAEQFRVVATVPAASAQAIVDKLVTRGWVTGWQAEALLKGVRKFHLGGFRLLRELGVGTMGKVYMAREQAANRIVALKMLSPDLIDDRQSLERFRREARAAGALNHPNIVAALGAGQVEKTHFLVMEYVAGKSLVEWIDHHQRLPVGWSCECVRQAALGLQHAFERGVVHRDIKPGNLMVTGEGFARAPTVKILDMGLARFTRERRDAVEISQTNNSVGTAEYMAPEQALDAKHVDIRADVYALGGTLYRCLTGEVPFAGLSALQMMMRKLETPTPSILLKRPDLPPELAKIIDRMLATRPEDRYATPGEVATALTPYCVVVDGDGSISTIPTPAPDAKTQVIVREAKKKPADAPAGKPASAAPRRLGRALLVLALLAAAVGVGAYVFMQ